MFHNINKHDKNLQYDLKNNRIGNLFYSIKIFTTKTKIKHQA